MVGPESDRSQQELLGKGAQGELNLGLPKTESPEVPARKELITKANKVLLLFAERAIPALRGEVREGKGRQVIASTQEGRPGEEQIGVDQPAENILKAAIREAQLPAIFISEGTPEPTEFGNGNGSSEKFYVYSDPFDNSSPYKRGLDIPPYTVCSIWDKDGQPIGAVIGDIKDRKAYVSMGNETFMWDFEKKPLERQAFSEWETKSLKDHIRLLEKKTQLISDNPDQIKKLSEIDRQLAELNKPPQDNQERSSESILAEKEWLEKRTNLINESPELQQFIENGKQISDIKEKARKNQEAFSESQKQEPERRKIMRSERTTLTDRESTLASFLGENEYSLEFFRDFKTLVKNMHRKGYLYPGGGAFIYGLLASGAIDAYVMRNEPLSEIIPGLPLALAAGCTVVAVNEDGTYQEFKFNPNALKENHKLYSEGSVPLFIAAATPEIRDEIIKSYMDEKGKREKNARIQALKDEFIAAKGQEFEIFIAPQPPAN